MADSTDKRRFATAFNFLAATKNTPVDGVKLTAYYKELGQIPIAALEEAAHDLGGEPSPYLPDAGTWKARAEQLATDRLTRELSQEVQHLTAGREPERDEAERIIAARNRFFDTYARVTGRAIAPDHPLRTQQPVIPTFGCQMCRDFAWIEDIITTRHRRCQCWSTNPVLQARRAHAQSQRRRKHVR